LLTTNTSAYHFVQREPSPRIPQSTTEVELPGKKEKNFPAAASAVPSAARTRGHGRKPIGRGQFRADHHRARFFFLYGW